MEEFSIENKCCICLDDINLETNKLHTLDCNHTFHTNCIIDWFRTHSSNGRCPLCNISDDNNQFTYLSWYNRDYVTHRFNIIKKYGKKKEAPIKLKNELIKLKNTENELILLNKEKADFYKRDDIRELKKLDKKYREQSWNKKNKVLTQKTKIVALFPCITAI